MSVEVPTVRRRMAAGMAMGAAEPVMKVVAAMVVEPAAAWMKAGLAAEAVGVVTVGRRWLERVTVENRWLGAAAVEKRRVRVMTVGKWRVGTVTVKKRWVRAGKVWRWRVEVVTVEQCWVTVG
ncbi:hypothetical protein ABT369_36900 [Dactylosporangium sp. NPDC000244]|uniref:hypothetical protein n=1 Tax=Dactylosporangium sp. NPDC000244 TaxID=3154365 RepID=UPI00331CDD1E